MGDQRPPGTAVTGRHARRREVDLAGAQPRSGRWLRRVVLVWAALAPPLWSRAKVKFAIVAPMAAVALLISGGVQLATPKARNSVAVAALAIGVVVLLAWIAAVAVPLVVKGKLPDGRNVADVLARQRIRRQITRDSRQALRHRRHSPSYAGPHAHRSHDREQAGKSE
ncbi:MAG TPA: hypothetical protein VMA72_26220 [Streptosporangiaceae bacterium]|nr:hypothetical protein [Streptosporangiaceae bacterium]